MRASVIARSVTVDLGGRRILSGIELQVDPGRRIGLIGPNGVGKSTLLGAVAGACPLEEGSVDRSPAEATIGWLRQEPERSSTETVSESIWRRTGVAAADAELQAATGALAEGTAGADDRYGTALDQWLNLGAADLDARIGEVTSELGMAAALLDQPTATLSGGEAARASLAAILLSRYDLYLLDEPTNDLDLDGLDRLERWVLDQSAGMVIVSHDRRFLSRVVTDVAEIDEFSRDLSRYAGGWEAFLAEREVARRHAWERFEQYDAQRRQLAGRAQREREWASQGQAKIKRSNEGDKHIRAFKMNQTEQLAGKAARTDRAMDRLEQVDKPREPWQLHMEVATTSRSGELVAELRQVVAERGQFRLGPVDLTIAAGDRVAVLGHNGSGKTTLIDLILGRTSPTSGSVRMGSSVVVGEIEQMRHQLTGSDAESSLLRVFQNATGLEISEARTLLAKFSLVADHVNRPAAELSPGERTRAALALLMANGVNLLVLDEPTNHLDLPAIEQLEAAVDTFDGTVILVTHDREFLDRFTATRTVRLDRGRIDDSVA